MQVTIPGYGAALLRLSNATPNLTVAGVVNGATFQSGPVAPGEIVSSSEQVNAVVPYSVAGKSATVLQIEHLGVLSNPVTLQVAATAPGVFSMTGSAKVRARL
jgi:hypothetical protein